MYVSAPLRTSLMFHVQRDPFHVRPNQPVDLVNSSVTNRDRGEPIRARCGLPVHEKGGMLLNRTQ
jgi:hypothetical protein